jgi:hypothetical protein
MMVKKAGRNDNAAGFQTTRLQFRLAVRHTAA